MTRSAIVLSVLAGVCCLQPSAANARQLDTTSSISAAWTAGPTRIVLAQETVGTDNVRRWMALEQVGTTSTWKGTGILTTATNKDALAPVVINVAPGNWETHVFYPKRSVGSNTTVVGHQRRTHAGAWLTDTMPAMPGGVLYAHGPAAVSNVYSAGNTLEPQSTVPQMAVYVIGTDTNLWSISYNGGTWSSWRNLGRANTSEFFTCWDGASVTCQPMTATAFFNNGAFSTSVWYFDSSGRLNENFGTFNNSQRSWSIVTDPGWDRTKKPAVVTWYPPTSARNPSFAHTRIGMSVATNHGQTWAFWREPSGATGYDVLNNTTSADLSIGPSIQSCGLGCPNPPVTVRLVAKNNVTGDLMFIDKDNSNPNDQGVVDVWTTIPRPSFGAGLSSRFTRLPYGGGMGALYALSNDGHLLEFNPSTNQWVDRSFP